MTQNETNSIPVDRFMQFMAADIEGETAEAERLAREMVEKDGVPESFLDDYLAGRHKQSA